jgi:hypothetical protein
VDERRFVESLIAAVPEAFAVPDDQLDDPLPYVSLGWAPSWLEEHALQISLLPRRASVRPEHADVMGEVQRLSRPLGRLAA